MELTLGAIDRLLDVLAADSMNTYPGRQKVAAAPPVFVQEGQGEQAVSFKIGLFAYSQLKFPLLQSRGGHRTYVEGYNSKITMPCACAATNFSKFSSIQFISNSAI